MAEPELGPTELDRLEDALEELEGLDAGALERWLEDEPSPQVRSRLADYRTILAVSREALPIEDVPTGVLDGVLAEAQQAAAVAPAAAVAGQGSWWSRMRRTFMVPALALAGTAVLVLWVFDPADQATLTDPPPPASPTASAPTAQAELASEDDARRGEVPELAEQAASEATPAAQPTVPAPEADAELEADAAKDAPDQKPSEPSGDAPGMSSLGGVSTGENDKAEPQQQAGGAAGPASGRWDLVSRGDRARQAGDCVAARAEYSLALEDDEARVRARAFAGMGLCDAQAGNGASADANFERARELDGGIGGFIDSQQQRSRPSQKRKRASKKSKPKINIDEMNDPFGP